MTVSTLTYQKSFTGNGATTNLPTGFEFFDLSDLVVQIETVATGAVVTKTITTDYTLLSGGSGEVGTVQMVVAPATGEITTITRRTPRTQSADYTATDAFPADSHEQVLDRKIMIAQEGIGYAVVAHILDNATDSGTFTSGDFRTRPINKVVIDTAGIVVSLATNSVTAKAGKYKVTGYSQGYQVGVFKMRVSGGGVIVYGTAADSPASGGTNQQSNIDAILDLPSDGLLEISVKCTTTKADTGFGLPAGALLVGEEVYAVITIERIEE